jgi:inner membrane protein
MVAGFWFSLRHERGIKEPATSNQHPTTRKMPSALTHAFIALPLGKTFFEREMHLRFWLLAILCSILPDVDVYSFYFRTGYGGLFWHRGFTHSLLFAFLLSSAAVWVAFREDSALYLPRWKLWLFFFLLACSHGALDALTGRGYGVAFFSPFDTTRYSFPWAPIRISPIGLKSFFSPRGKEVILNEVQWVWIPSVLLLVTVRAFRLLKSRGLRRMGKGSEE